MTKPRVTDANVVLRYLLADHPALSKRASEFLSQVRDGNEKALIPEGVIVECVHVLMKVYGVPRSEVAEMLSGLLRYHGIVNPDREVLLEALTLFERYRVDIVDAIVFVVAKHYDWPTFSFDKDIRKLEHEADPSR
jgi:predicted nucleic-acid-binding protein